MELNGKPIEYHDEALLRHRRSIGTVFQAFNLFPHLTALQNITLPLEKVHGRTPDEARELAEGTLRRFQLLDHAHKRPAELSGGQRQRVAIARAIAIKPQVVLLDEPTSALDPEMTAEVLELIEELKGEGRDLLLVTHEMGFARRLADRVALLADGRIAEIGPAGTDFRRAPVGGDARFSAARPPILKAGAFCRNFIYRTFASPGRFSSGLINGSMVTARKLLATKSKTPKALGAVVRQQLLLINGLLDEVARNYLARLHRETGELIRTLERHQASRGLSGRQMKDLQEMLKRIGRLQIDPERGRRKDLKKIDALIGEIQSIVERW